MPVKPRVWIRVKSPPVDVLAPLEDLAEVVTDADPESLPGSRVVESGGINRTDGAMMDRVGPELQLLAMPGIGLNHIDLKAASERGILVCNNPDGPTESTAEHTVALLLAVAKRVMTGDMQMRGADIPRLDMRGTELRGLTLGILGFGRIGRRVAEICGLGLGMKVLVHDPFIDQSQIEAPGFCFAEDMEAVFTKADVVSLHTPLTDGTRHLVGEPQLRLMKRGSYLINASRGPVIDEMALIRVLQEGHLAGAGLDVFDPEPPEADNPLLRMPNVVVTPHIASYTDAGVRRMWGGTAHQIGQVLRGERPTHLANPEAWPGRVGQG
ncbi:MAG: hydroxyacid dehydrogenase [Anaerolineae bacterium]|nr:hydroxyacid dehydrogenase [Anaerolineae bacterium]